MRPDELITEADLKHPDMAGRYEAMLALEAAGRLRDEDLRDLCLRDEAPFIRKRALRIAGESRGEAMLPVLREALADGDPMVRIVAAEQIHALALGGRGIALGEALEPLFRDPDPGVRGRALSLFVHADERRGGELLVDLFIESLDGRDDEATARIATILGPVWGRRTERRLRKQLDRLDGESRHRADRALDAGGIRLS
jgi:HEAT repeat protein